MTPGGFSRKTENAGSRMVCRRFLQMFREGRMKGILLAGGAGSRLHPVTQAISKQLIPIYDKPMVYYPLSVLMLAGIREALLVTTPRDLPVFRSLIGDGGRLGMRIDYAEQPRPEGIAQAFLIAGDFLGDEPACLILGDNIFYGQGFTDTLRDSVRATTEAGTARIFAYPVSDPDRFGIVEFDETSRRALSLEEKPKQPKSNFAVPGLYFYGAGVAETAREVKPGARGELEITDLNRLFMERGRLEVVKMGRGVAWLDTGTPRSLMDASMFIQAIEERQGLKVACLEEIAYDSGWIDEAQVAGIAAEMGDSSYGRYLRRFIRA